MKKNNVIIISVCIVVVIIGIIIAMLLLNNKPVANGVILDKKDIDYQNVLIKTYNDYIELLKKYEVSDRVLLTNNDLINNDYIIDFILYDDSLKINKIDINITEDGVKIMYKVNKEIKDDNKYLMYFIPIEKDLLNGLNIIKRDVVVD